MNEGSEITIVNAKSFVNIQAFAKRKKVSRQYIHSLIKQNRIHPEPVRIGKYFYISKSAKIKKGEGK